MTVALYLQIASGKPYREGRHDCATFLGGWVDHLAGTDYEESFFKYRTILEGRRKLAPQGIAKRVEEELLKSGFKERADWKPGDIAILENDAAAIMDEEGFCCSVPLGLSGLVKINPRHAIKFFRYVPVS